MKEVKNYTAETILKTIQPFHWSNLARLIGCAHSSIIGLIAYEWIMQSASNNVMDGAPSPPCSTPGRKGQVNADLLLCDEQFPIIPVEVETQVIKYTQKLKTIIQYFKNYDSIGFGLMYLTNLTKDKMNKYEHNWDDLKEEIKQNEKYPICLVSGLKTNFVCPTSGPLSSLYRSNYAKWKTNIIEYWIYGSDKTILKGQLYNGG